MYLTFFYELLFDIKKTNEKKMRIGVEFLYIDFALSPVVIIMHIIKRNIAKINTPAPPPKARGWDWGGVCY